MVLVGAARGFFNVVAGDAEEGSRLEAGTVAKVEEGMLDGGFRLAEGILPAEEDGVAEVGALAAEMGVTGFCNEDVGVLGAPGCLDVTNLAEEAEAETDDRVCMLWWCEEAEVVLF